MGKKKPSHRELMHKIYQYGPPWFGRLLLVLTAPALFCFHVFLCAKDGFLDACFEFAEAWRLMVR